MVGASITVANSTDYKPVWTGNPPADFGTDMAQLQTNYGNITVLAAQADAATGGGGDASSAAETALENAAFILARALANHFKKNGDLDNLGKVDVTKTDIVRLRKQVLLDKATAILNLASAAVSDPAAAGRGVTAARIGSLFETCFSKETLEALRMAEALPQVKKQDYELRFLDIPAVYFVAVWLHAESDDILIPLPPAFGRWSAYQPCSESDMIKLLKPEAKKVLKQPNLLR